MKCNQVQNYLIDYIDRNLDHKKNQAIAAHLQQCSDCRKAMQELHTLLREIDQDEQKLPDDSIKQNFEKMLQNERALLKESKVIPLTKTGITTWKSILQVAATIVLVVLAYFYGRMSNNSESFSRELAVLEKEKLEMKEAMTISLIENESASKRLKAVNYAEEFEKPGNDILKALIDKMYYDEHTNVRLAAAEALAKFSERELVRKALIKALKLEIDPSLQIELIQILISIQEKRAVPVMEKLLLQEETPDYVKDQIHIGLPSLI